MLLTSKQRLHFSIRSKYWNSTFVLMSIKPREQPEWSPCKCLTAPYLSNTYRVISFLLQNIWIWVKKSDSDLSPRGRAAPRSYSYIPIARGEPKNLPLGKYQLTSILGGIPSPNLCAGLSSLPYSLFFVREHARRPTPNQGSPTGGSKNTGCAWSIWES